MNTMAQATTLSPSTPRIEPVVRPEFVLEPVQAELASIQRPLSTFETLYRLGWLRKTVILCVLAIIWEIYGRWLDNALLFPSFTDTLGAFVNGLTSGVLLLRAAVSLKTLLIGYGIGIALAAVLNNPARFAVMVEKAGFSRVQHRNLMGGIVAIHSGYKI